MTRPTATCVECECDLSPSEIAAGICSECGEAVDLAMATCVVCECLPCCCPDSSDFCDVCGNPDEECSCPYLEPLDDVDANTRGDIW